MTNGVYVIHDTRNDTKIVCRDYDAYITYYQEELKPEGLGTRHLFSEITKAQQFYHFRLCIEKRDKNGLGDEDEEETIP